MTSASTRVESMVPPPGTRVRAAARQAGLVGPRVAVRSTLAGKVLASAYRRRRRPGRMVQAEWLAWRDGKVVHSGRDGTGQTRAVVVITAGPGSAAALIDTVDSIRHYLADASIVVVDDGTVDCRAKALEAALPTVDVVRNRWPSCEGFRIWGAVQVGMLHALENYGFDLLIKLDTDALVVGPGLIDAALARFDSDPGIGALGTCGVGPAGRPESYAFDRWVLAHERRWSPRLRRVVERACATSPAGPTRIQGGAYLVHRRALDAALASGLLPWRLPPWSFLGEDMIVSLLTQAAGFRLASFGGPGEPIACALNQLPLGLDQIAEESRMVVHSVRRGRDGEEEATIRDHFKALRARESA